MRTRVVPVGLFARSLLTALAVLSLAAAASTPADAKQSRRGQRETFARYAEPALRDSLMASFSTPGVVVVERDFVTFGAHGSEVGADVTYERVIFVREADGLSAYKTFSLPDYPGHELKKMEAVRIAGDDHKKLDVKKEKVIDCSLHKKQREWRVDFGDFEAGDMLCVKAEYEIRGVNPTFRHTFDRDLPIVQTDVTFEVPRDLMEGRARRAFHWWAGSYPGGIEQNAWERPRSWRFRWGERGVEPSSGTPRVVASTWMFDPREMGTAMEGRELQAAGNSDLAYTGPTLSAQDLSGRWSDSRTHGERARSEAKPTTASLGDLEWANIAEQVAFLRLAELIDTNKGLERELGKRAAKNASPADVVKAVASIVSDDIDTIDLPLARMWREIKRPTDVIRRPCASKLDKAVLATALLRMRGIRAYPVLMKEGKFDTDLVSVNVFDDVCVRVEGETAGFIDVDTGKVSERIASTWQAILYLDEERSMDGLVHGDDLAELTL